MHSLVAVTRPDYFGLILRQTDLTHTASSIIRDRRPCNPPDLVRCIRSSQVQGAEQALDIIVCTLFYLFLSSFIAEIIT